MPEFAQVESCNKVGCRMRQLHRQSVMKTAAPGRTGTIRRVARPRRNDWLAIATIKRAARITGP
jgi:hypothetical protein